MNQLYGRKEMLEDYAAILSHCNGDRERARECLEAYLAGRAGFMPQTVAGRAAIAKAT